MITVAIPTLNRGKILVSCIRRLLALAERPADILVVDQTREHDADVAVQLAEWAAQGVIRHIVLTEASIPNAMNVALTESRTRLILFLDDDSEASEHLLSTHVASYEDASVWAVVGQVLQPGEVPSHFDDRRLHLGVIRDLEFRFNHDEDCFIENAIACNMSVDRDRARAIGGFDANYVAAAHRFETDFARRLINAGGRILFNAAASVRHLKLATGGLRSYGDHRVSASPLHSVGDYYFALHHVSSPIAYSLRRLRQNVITRHHLRNPWTIPAKLLGEIRGMLLARRLFRQGPRLLPAARLSAGNSTGA
jgi:GT2 family glycosyltransferase